MFLDYPFAKKDYKILTLHSKQISISRDVKFVESILLFSIFRTLSQLFPTSCPLSQNKETALSLLPPLDPDLPPSNPTPSHTSLENSPALSNTPEPQLCKSTREHHTPTYLSDYICSNAFSVIYPNPPCFPLRERSFSTMTTPNESLLTSICQITKPTSYHRVVLYPS